MPTLTLMFKKNEIKTYRLEKGQSISIGRRETNDVVIASLVISGDHARIDAMTDGYLLTDLQSKNGTYVNNQPIAYHRLKHGDIITIGKHSLKFAYAEDEARPDDTEVGMDRTMIMDTDRFHQHGLPLDLPMKHLPKRQPVGTLSFVAGGNGTINLTKKMTTVGRDPSNDILVPGLFIGKTAFTISKTPKDEYVLSFVGGFVHPRVNDTVVKESIKLKEFDAIRIGSVEMQFFYQK